MKNKFWTYIFGFILLAAVILAIAVVTRTNTAAEELPEEEQILYLEPTWQVTYPTGTCYAVVDLNMRLEPDIKGQFFRSTQYGSKLVVDHFEGDWAYLRYSGAYVYAGYLAHNDPAENFNLSTDGLDSAKYAGYVIDLISELPTPIQKIVKDYKILLVSEPINKPGLPTETITLGYTSITNNGHDRTIELFTNNNYLETTVYHEIGHTLDYWYASNHHNTYFSDTQEMKDALEREEEALYTIIDPLRQTMITDNKELFAECYRLFITEPKNLEETAPATFAYMQKFLTNIYNGRY